MSVSIKAIMSATKAYAPSEPGSGRIPKAAVVFGSSRNRDGHAQSPARPVKTDAIGWAAGRGLVWWVGAYVRWRVEGWHVRMRMSWVWGEHTCHAFSARTRLDRFTHTHTFARAEGHVHGIDLAGLEAHVVHLMLHLLAEDHHLVAVDHVPAVITHTRTRTYMHTRTHTHTRTHRGVVRSAYIHAQVGRGDQQLNWKVACGWLRVEG
jgi:hypothetical protein